MMSSANEPVSDMTYFDCIDSVVENSKSLG